MAFAILASAALLTKETALVLPVSALLFSFLKIFIYKEKEAYLLFTNLLCIAFPMGVFGVFLYLQKLQNGWYFFPMHTDLMSFKWVEIIATTKIYLKFVFLYQGRWLCTLVGALGLCMGFLKGSNKLSNFSLLSLVFLVVFFSFSAFNFVMMRYMMPAITLLIVLLFVCLQHLSKKLMIPILLLLSAVAYSHKTASHFSYDEDMSYRDQVISQQLATD